MLLKCCLPYEELEIDSYSFDQRSYHVHYIHSQLLDSCQENDILAMWF